MASLHLSDASVLEEKHSWVFQVPKSTCHWGEISPLLPAHLGTNSISSQWWHNPELQHWDFALCTYKEKISAGKVVYKRKDSLPSQQRNSTRNPWQNLLPPHLFFNTNQCFERCFSTSPSLKLRSPGLPTKALSTESSFSQSSCHRLLEIMLK